MTAVVTGGSGVVGGAVIRHLVAAGMHPLALSRTAASDDVLTQCGARPIRGDILDEESLVRAFDGADLVYHAAGLNTMCPKDPDLLMRVNVDGSRTVLRACHRAGVRRLVYTSSAAAIGEPAGTVGSEDTIHRGWYLSHYERSKHLAELAVFSEAGDVDVVSVNPSSVQGPGRATGTGKMILDLVNGRFPLLVDTRASIVDIDDCARGHLLAAERGVAGQRYLLNSFTISLKVAVGMVERILDRPIRVFYVPGWVAAFGAGAVEAVFRVRGRQPLLCREMVRTVRHGHTYDGSKAETALGITYTSADATLRRLLDWFRTEGLVSR